MAHFYTRNIIFLSYETSYLNWEINCTEPSPLVRVPWFYPWSYQIVFRNRRCDGGEEEGEVVLASQLFDGRNVAAQTNQELEGHTY